jgi:hypothetical protein
LVHLLLSTGKPVKPFRLLLLVSLALVPGRLSAQAPALGATVTGLADGGEGIDQSCPQRSYRFGLGAVLAIPVLSQWTSLQANVRGYGVDVGPTCADGFPPPDGTYIMDERVELLSRKFLTTDVRLAAQLGESPLRVALGAGNAWHEGYNLPYGVFGADLALVSRPTYGISLGAELQMLRVTADRFRRTYQDFTLVSEESLGRVHRWSHALVLGFTATGQL